MVVIGERDGKAAVGDQDKRKITDFDRAHGSVPSVGATERIRFARRPALIEVKIMRAAEKAAL
jgi:hypothetical protein